MSTPDVNIEHNLKSVSSSANITVPLEPENFIVEGEPKIEMDFEQDSPEIQSKQAKNKTVKEKRNSGDVYHSEKSDRLKTARKTQMIPKCNGSYCKARKLECDEFSEEQRESIRNAFYLVGSLQGQREWVARHIVSEPCKGSSRKKRNTHFFLPKDEGIMSSPFRVCKKMFLSTVGISDRQVRTVIKKTWTV